MISYDKVDGFKLHLDQVSFAAVLDGLYNDPQAFMNTTCDELVKAGVPVEAAALCAAEYFAQARTAVSALMRKCLAE